jgi:hypothetical protein
MASVLATTAVTTAAPFLQNIKMAAQQLKPLIKEFKETVEMTTDEIKDVVVTVKEAEQDITNAVTSVDNQGKLYELQSNLELEEAKKDILETDYSNPVTPDYSIPVTPELTSIGKDYVGSNNHYNDIANSSSNLPSINNPNLDDAYNPYKRQIYSGGKKFSLKHIQKGGRLAAKRTRKSINEFLNSSVTSSYIYNMTKNGGKRKSKRKRSNKNKRSLKRIRR